MSAVTPYKSSAEDFIARFRTEKSKPESLLAAQTSIFLLAAVLVAATLAPIFLLSVPPLTDFPAHLVRVSLLADLPLDPLLARAWQVDFRPLPNLAMDLFVMALAPLTGAALAIKLFVALGAGLWMAGAVLLHRALWREWALQPLFAALFLVNPSFIGGFINCYFGFGLALTAAGLWALAEKRPFWVCLAMSGVALVLLTCHLMALGVLALMLGGLELGRLWSERAGPARIARSATEGLIVFAPAALVWALVFEHGQSGGVEFKWLNNLVALFAYSSQAGGIDHNILPSAALFGALALAWRAGRLRISGAAAPAVALVTAAMLLCPSSALSGAYIHIRLPALVCIVILAAARIEAEPRWLKPALAALLIATTAFGALSYARWRPGAEAIEAIRAAAAAHIEKGARVATAMVDVRGDAQISRAVSPVALDRSAFLPDFFTYKGQSTIVVTDAYRKIASLNAEESAIPSLTDAIALLGPAKPALSGKQARALRPYADMACEIDYLYVIGDLPPSLALPAALRPVATGGKFTLFRIVAPAERGCPARG